MMFPESARQYLRRHKGDADPIEHLCDSQVRRARKQVEDLAIHLAWRRVDRLLDVGCGLAVVDVLLARQYGVRELFLVDGAEPGERHCEHRDDSQPWNDVAVAVEFVRVNAPPSLRHLSGVWPEEPVDAVLSLKSWGFHYPVRTYAGAVTRLTRPGGLLVVDLHRPGARAEIEGAGFRFLGQMGEWDGLTRAQLPFVRHVFERRADGSA